MIEREGEAGCLLESRRGSDVFVWEIKAGCASPRHQCIYTGCSFLPRKEILGLWWIVVSKCQLCVSRQHKKQKNKKSNSMLEITRDRAEIKPLVLCNALIEIYGAAVLGMLEALLVALYLKENHVLGFCVCVCVRAHVCKNCHETHCPHHCFPLPPISL